MLTFKLRTPLPSDLQTRGMSFVFQQEHTGAEIAYSTEAEAVETAPWPSQKQTPGELGMCLCEASAAAGSGKSLGTVPCPGRFIRQNLWKRTSGLTES